MRSVLLRWSGVVIHSRRVNGERRKTKMARVLILGGGFGGVVAAERLANELSDEHQITLVSRSRQFVFYPALVRLAFHQCERDDVAFDLRRSMLSRRVNFIEGEVARVYPNDRKVVINTGDVEGKLPYDYLVFALGRRLATERITGFYEYAHQVLNVEKAIKFGRAVDAFQTGHAVIGMCAGARLPTPVFETAFALAGLLKERGQRDGARITIISPSPPELELGDAGASAALRNTLDSHGIELLSNLNIERVTPTAVITTNGFAVNYDLLMLMPPFVGSPAATSFASAANEHYINVDSAMRVVGYERIYAIGDCVNFTGPKMGHMATRQAEVAAANLAAEIDGHQPVSNYAHEMRAVIDEGGGESIYVHKDLWTNEPADVRQGRFWRWAKFAHEKYWEASHS